MNGEKGEERRGDLESVCERELSECVRRERRKA